jgi:hypothetical protein
MAFRSGAGRGAGCGPFITEGSERLLEVQALGVIRRRLGDPCRLVVNMSPRDAPDLGVVELQAIRVASNVIWTSKTPRTAASTDLRRLVSHIGTQDDPDLRRASRTVANGGVADTAHSPR